MWWIKAATAISKIKPHDIPTQLNIQDVIDMVLSVIGGN